MRRLAMLTLLLTAGGVIAQVPNTFVYQGVLDQAGTPANGEFDFQFELFDDPDFVLGMSFAGPVTVLDFGVSEGDFAVPVDFGMDVFGDIPLFLEVRVRDAASNGAFTVLEPRQPLYAVPLAVHALNVGADVVGGAQIADASVTAADLAPSAVGAAAVNSADVQLRVSGNCAAGSAVRSVNGDGTVSCEPVPAGDITAVTPGAGLTGGGSTGSAELAVDFGQVQARLQGGCEVGELLAGIAADGTPVCTVPPIPATASVISDPAGSVGTNNSILIGTDGLPLVVFYSQSPSGVVAVHCNDVACFGSDESEVLLEAGAGDEGIAAIAGADGLPLIAYHQPATNQVKLLRCNDPACSGGDESTSVIDSAPGIYDISMALDASGFPVVAFLANGPGGNEWSVFVLRCNDVACAGGDDTVNPAETLSFGPAMSPLNVAVAIGSDNNPFLIYRYSPFASVSEIFALKCNDSQCSGEDESTVDLGMIDIIAGLDVRIDGAGNPVYALYDAMTPRLDLIRCATPTCQTIATTESIEFNGGGFPSLLLGPGDRPSVAYCSRDFTLRYATCNDAACAGGDDTLADTGSLCNGTTAHAMGSDGLPVISYPVSEPAGTYAKVYHCVAPACR